MKRKLVVGLLTAVALVVGMVAVPAQTASSSENKDRIVLSADNTLVLNDVVDDTSVSAVLQKAQELTKPSLLDKLKGKKKRLRLFLYTPGGSIQAGLELRDGLHGLGVPVDTITLFAASMGFQIAQNMDERLILPSGVLMSHHAAGGFEGEFGGQAPSQIDSRYGLWLDRIKELDLQTVKRTDGRQTLASYQKAYENELWLTPAKAIAGGYADRVVTVTCDESLSGLDKKTVNFMGITIHFEVSKCPLITGVQNVSMDIPSTKGLIAQSDFTAKNGGFGPYCMQSESKDKLCALDTTLTEEKLQQLKEQFRSRYEQRARTPIRMDVRYNSYSFDYNNGLWIGK